jgi:hypothetical protein
VRLLLDTHVALWAIADDDRLSAKARRLIEDAENDIVVSAATVWEISIKHALARGGPNDMPISGEEALGYFKDAGFEFSASHPSMPRRSRPCRRCTRIRSTGSWSRRH